MPPELLRETILPRLSFAFMGQHKAVFDFTLQYKTRAQVRHIRAETRVVVRDLPSFGSEEADASGPSAGPSAGA